VDILKTGKGSTGGGSQPDYNKKKKKSHVAIFGNVKDVNFDATYHFQ